MGFVQDASRQMEGKLEPINVHNQLGHWISLKAGRPHAAASTIGTGANTRPIQLLASMVVADKSPAEALFGPEFVLDPTAPNPNVFVLLERCNGEASPTCASLNRLFGAFSADVIGSLPSWAPKYVLSPSLTNNFCKDVA